MNKDDKHFSLTLYTPFFPSRHLFVIIIIIIILLHIFVFFLLLQTLEWKNNMKTKIKKMTLHWLLLSI